MFVPFAGGGGWTPWRAGQMVEECRLALMQSKYLEQRQEVIMRKFCSSLPVLTSVTLRTFMVCSVTGRPLPFSPETPVNLAEPSVEQIDALCCEFGWFKVFPRPLCCSSSSH